VVGAQAWRSLRVGGLVSGGGYGGAQLLSHQLEQFTEGTTLARRQAAGLLIPVGRRGILARLADQGPKLLGITFGVLFQPDCQRRIVGDQALAPVFCAMKHRRFGSRTPVLFVQGGANGLHCFGIEPAHEFADELHLPATPLEMGDSARLCQRFGEGVGQFQTGQQLGPQIQQGFAQGLAIGTFALELGFAGFVTAFELAFELKIKFAAFGNKLAADEVATLRFSGHKKGGAHGAEGASIIAATMKNAPQPTSASHGFSFSRRHFEGLVDEALAHARRLGATDAGAEASEGCGLSVSVRKGAVETVERNRDKSLGVTVYVGHRRGNASTSDFSSSAIAQTVQAAYDIARFTAEDPVAGLPEEELVECQPRDLDLFHPWAITSEDAVVLAQRCEAAAFATDRRITNSEGAAVSVQQSHFFSAHTHGFRGGYASSRHTLSVAPIAGRGAGMQRDAWYSSMRDPRGLAAPEAVGRYAAERALSRLKARKIATTECPVLFESPLAAGLLGSFVQAVSGGALYRRSSFLLDSLGKRVFPAHLDVDEDPFEPAGKGSVPFDDEGVRVAPRRVVDAGRVAGYFLSTYSARKLGMTTTGNAGGSHNLRLTSRRTRPGDDLDAMLKKLGTGLFVIELMGQGVNYVTGDYSRGASGFWVENGEIAFPVEEITIAGNLKTMFKGIEAVGADAYNYGAKTVGSILINRMKVAGS